MLTFTVSQILDFELIDHKLVRSYFLYKTFPSDFGHFHSFSSCHNNVIIRARVDS